MKSRKKNIWLTRSTQPQPCKLTGVSGIETTLTILNEGHVAPVAEPREIQQDLLDLPLLGRRVEFDAFPQN